MLSCKLTFADVEVDLMPLRTRRAGRDVGLSFMEHRMLLAIARDYPRSVLRFDLHIDVIGRAWQDETNVVQVHIARLREKLGEPLRSPSLILTTQYGYQLGARPSLVTTTVSTL